jgi:hypothetical protein
MVEGGCFCGAVRYRIAATPASSAICHCTSCRRASGAPAVAWLTVNRSDFAWLSGAPVQFGSSPGVTRRFCGRCGSGLTYEHAALPATIDITNASLDDPERFAPTMEVWLQDKLSWQPTGAHLSRYPGSSLD